MFMVSGELNDVNASVEQQTRWALTKALGYMDMSRGSVRTLLTAPVLAFLMTALSQSFPLLRRRRTCATVRERLRHAEHFDECV